MRFREYNPYPTKTDYGSKHIRFRYYQFRAHPKWLWDIMRNSVEVCNMLSVTQLSWKEKMKDEEFLEKVKARRVEKIRERNAISLEVRRLDREKALDLVREKIEDLDMVYPVRPLTPKEIISFDDKGNYTWYKTATSYARGRGLPDVHDKMVSAIKARVPYKYCGLYWGYRYKYVEE